MTEKIILNDRYKAEPQDLVVTTRDHAALLRGQDAFALGYTAWYFHEGARPEGDGVKPTAWLSGWEFAAKQERAARKAANK